MSAAKQNITIEQYTTFVKPFTWLDKNRRAINLTGYTADMQLRDTASSETILFEFDTTNGLIVITPLKGIIEVDLTTAAASSTLKSAVYDLILTSPGGKKVRLMEGKITISPGVTRG